MFLQPLLPGAGLNLPVEAWLSTNKYELHEFMNELHELRIRNTPVKYKIILLVGSRDFHIAKNNPDIKN